jgi:electron transfer flavoprotein alpha subunit
MGVLVFAEQANGKFKKATLEACTYASDLASAQGVDAYAVLLGNADAAEIEKLGQYGIRKVFQISGDLFQSFTLKAWIRAIESAARASGSQVVVLPQSYNGRSIAPGISVRLQAAFISGVTSLPTQQASEWHFTRPAFSGKGIETISALSPAQVITVKANGYMVTEKPGSCTVEQLSVESNSSDKQVVAKEQIRASSKISLTEADVVVSGGRGLKGPENWGLVENLAELLGAATACSKPVSDVEWRPHHEHVGQTGIQIAPNLYIAIGISGAIQHLAGVNSSKVIVVVNKDPEAPFFKAADYGIVGDAFEVVPRITQAIQELKKAN